jgi:predicted metal-dependent hydrolase
MRLVDVGGRLVEVHVRESARARRTSAVWRPGEPPEVVVPAGMGERGVDRALLVHRDWLRRQLAKERPPVLGLDQVRLTEREGRAVARRRLREVAEREADRLGLEYMRIAVRDTRTRWGSCSTRGTLSFSWRLVLAPAEVLEYVVVHELCHLRIHDHSPRFWRFLEQARPGYEAERTWLHEHGWELLAFRPLTGSGVRRRGLTGEPWVPPSH